MQITMSCHRCTQIKHNYVDFCNDYYKRATTVEETNLVDAEMLQCPIQKKGTEKCNTCLRFYCRQCYKIHDKHNECFCEIKTECFSCREKGVYDWTLHKVYCNNCMW